MDIVYIPFKISECSHNEIRVTLRSIERHCKDLDNLYIIGENYGFYSSNVKFVECKFDYSLYKYPFVPVDFLYEFVKSHYDELSEEFSLICDNICFIEDVTLSEFPNYWKYPLENCGIYTQKVYANAETDTYFASKFLCDGRFMNYETGFPLRINKEQFINSEDNVRYVISQSRSGIMFRSYYMNLTNTGEMERYDDKQYDLGTSLLKIKEHLANKDISMVCMTPQVWANGVFTVLMNEFPKRSKFENHMITL